VRRVCEALEHSYGSPRLGNPRDPLDDLVYVILSNKTSAATAKNVFRQVKTRFPDWGDVLGTRIRALRSILKPAGLSAVKSRQIYRALRKISEDFGSCSLRALRKAQRKDVQDYLTSLPGVSEKVAKCIMIYTLGFEVLPVDVHVHRICTRLGWTVRKRADQCHEELEALVPSGRRFIFHVGCVAHGRTVCRPANPKCQSCVLSRYCDYYKSL
jgi:endonuclease-3